MNTTSASPSWSHRPSVFVIFVAAIAALAGLLFGYDTGVISGAILFIRKDFNLSATMEGAVVSAVLLGATLSASLSGRLADHFGRKKVLITASLIFIFGSLGGALAPDPIVLIFSRLALGLAIGVASYTAPLYISEIAPPAVRGRLVGLNQLAITVGILASYVVDYAFAGHGQWPEMIGMGAVPAVLLALGTIFLPESPRWLLLHGRKEEGLFVLARIRSQSEAEAEGKEILETSENDHSGWGELFKPWMRPLLVIGLGLAIFQQFTGINTVIYYAPTIFRLAGFSSDSESILATAGVGVVNVVMTIVAIYLIDRLGRRPLLLAGLVGMAISLTALTLGFAGWVSPEALKIIGVVSLMLYVASFAISIGPIFWLIISEIYPLGIRGLAMSVATATCWISNLIVSFTFLLLIQGLGQVGTFALFTAITLVAIIFAYVVVPETKGRTLEEIEQQNRTA